MLLGSQCAGQFADGVAQAVIATVLVLDPLQQGTPERILSVFTLTLLPYSLISPFLGVFVDRWDRKTLLAATNLLRGVLLITIPLWSPAVPDDTGLLVAALGLLGLGRLFHTTKGAVLPVVLHEHYLLRGNAISSVGGTIALLAGGGVGLVLAQVMDANLAIASAGLVYGVGALVATRIRTDLSHEGVVREPVLAAVTRVARGLVDGIRTISACSAAVVPLVAVFLLRLFVMTVVVGEILLIKGRFEGTVSASGLALGAVGVGAFAASVAAPGIGRKIGRGGLMIAGFVVAGIGTSALAGIATVPALLVLMFCGGAGSFLTKVAVDAQVQAALPDVYRGRAFALYDILYNMASVFAAASIVASERASLRTVMVATGVVTLATAGAIYVAARGAGIAFHGAPPAVRAD